MSKTYFYKSEVLSNVIVLSINSERVSALRNAVEYVINTVYGEKQQFADGQYRYPWERQPYISVLKMINELRDSDDEVRFFGGFYCCVKFSLKKYADQNPLCAEMLREIEAAEKLEPKEAAIHMHKLALQQAEAAREMAEEADTAMYQALDNVLEGLGFKNNIVLCKKTNKLGMLNVRAFHRSHETYSIMFHPIGENGKPDSQYDIKSSVWTHNEHLDFEKRYDLLKDSYTLVKSINET